MTTKELAGRQAWTLEQKIDHAIGTIEAFIARTGKTPYVSFSGGKDSTVLLDICRRDTFRSIDGIRQKRKAFFDMMEYRKNMQQSLFPAYSILIYLN